MELLRDILIAIEESSHDPMTWMDLKVAGRSTVELAYHVQLLNEAGLIEAIDLSTSDGSHWEPKRLTWLGHEFLGDAKNNTVWGKTKARLGDQLGSASFEVVRSVLIEQAKGLFS